MEIHLIIAIILFVVGLCLLAHHGWVHFHDDPAESHAQKESCVWACYFQPKDVDHLESWGMVCLTSSFTTGVISPIRSDALAIGLCVCGAFLMLLAACRGFESHNILNHETWILVCFFSAGFAAF